LGAEWPVHLYGEDYLEYFAVCIELLNFILIERKIAIEKDQELERFIQKFKDEGL